MKHVLYSVYVAFPVCDLCGFDLHVPFTVLFVLVLFYVFDQTVYCTRVAFAVCCASIPGYRGGDFSGEQKSEEQDVRDAQAGVHH